MIILLSSLFLVSTFAGAGVASGAGDDERYERGERDEDDHEGRERFGDRD